MTREARKITAFRVDGKRANGVCWSPDGTRLAVGGESGACVVTTEGRELWRVPPTIMNGVWRIAWSPDSKHIAITPDAVGGGTLLVVDATTGNEIRSWTIATSFVSWHPNSRLLAWNRPNSLFSVTDVASGSETRTGGGEGDYSSSCAAFSPDGNFIASGSGQGDVHVLKVETGDKVCSLKGHTSRILGIGWSQDGARLVSCSFDTTIRNWDIKRQCQTSQCKHGSWVRSVALSRDGSIVASASADRTVRLWNAGDLEELEKLTTGASAVYDVAFSPEGQRLAAVDVNGMLTIWDVSDFVTPPAATEDSDDWNAFLTRHARTVGIAARLPQRELWIPHFPDETTDCLGTIRHGQEDVVRVALFPDGRRLATGHRDGHVRCWNLLTGESRLASATPNQRRIDAVTISPDGLRIASGSDNGIISVWDASNGEEIIKYQGHLASVRRLRWSINGRRLASGSEDNTARIWDSNTLQELACFRGHEFSIWGLDWSPDGTRLVTGSFDHTIRIWDAKTAKELSKWPTGAEVNSVAWSPDGRWVASGADDRVVRIWEVETGKQIRTLVGHSSLVLDVAWSPDGLWVVSAGQLDRTICVWNANTGREVRRFQSNEELVNRIDWSSDGAFLASGHKSGVVRFWDTRKWAPRQPKTESPVPLSASQQAAIRIKFGSLASCWTSLYQEGITPPLWIVRDWLDLLTGHSADPVWETLRSEPGLKELVGLNWPRAARLGLVALLMHGVSWDEIWNPPLLPDDPNRLLTVRDGLLTALAGDSVAPDRPDPPLVEIRAALRGINESLVSLLQLIGPDAVAADPGLAIRLQRHSPKVTPLSARQRRLLNTRLPRGSQPWNGQASGGANLGLPLGITQGTLPSDPQRLLPSQWALKPRVRLYKHLQGSLMLRERSLEEPPRLRPLVLVLDVSAEVSGEIESMTRLAAHAVATSLMEANLPVWLVTAGGDGTERELVRREDVIPIWTERTLDEPDVSKSLRIASILRESQRGGAEEPAILLLTHPWFGWQSPPTERIPHLRALFVQYKGYNQKPSLADHCTHWESIASNEFDSLHGVLSRVTG